MTCTNEDLKRLEEFLLSQDPGDPEFMPKTYLALLSRLRAAEAVCHEFKPYGQREIALMRAWRKERGE